MGALPESTLLGGFITVQVLGSQFQTIKTLRVPPGVTIVNIKQTLVYKLKLKIVDKR